MSNNQTSKNPVNGSNQTPDKLIRQFLNQPSVTTPVAYHPNNQFRPRNFYQNNRGPIRPSFSSNQVRPTTSFPKHQAERVIYQANQQPLGTNSTSANVARPQVRTNAINGTTLSKDDQVCITRCQRYLNALINGACDEDVSNAVKNQIMQLLNCKIFVPQFVRNIEALLKIKVSEYNFSLIYKYVVKTYMLSDLRAEQLR